MKSIFRLPTISRRKSKQEHGYYKSNKLSHWSEGNFEPAVLRCSNHNTHHFNTIINQTAISRLFSECIIEMTDLSVDAYLTGPNLPLRIQGIK